MSTRADTAAQRDEEGEDGRDEQENDLEADLAVEVDDGGEEAGALLHRGVVDRPVR